MSVIAWAERQTFKRLKREKAKCTKAVLIALATTYSTKHFEDNIFTIKEISELAIVTSKQANRAVLWLEQNGFLTREPVETFDEGYIGYEYILNWEPEPTPKKPKPKPSDFPLEQWFDLSKRITKEDRKECETQMAWYCHKDGDSTNSKEFKREIAQLRHAVSVHNSRIGQCGRAEQ